LGVRYLPIAIFVLILALAALSLNELELRHLLKLPSAGGLTPAYGQGEGDTTLEVHPGGSIQAALDKAPEGSVVLVHPGRYREHLTIEKTLTLRALPGTVVIVEGDDPQKATLSIQAPGVTVEGLTILRGQVGIDAAGGCRILGNTLAQAQVGLELAGGCLVEGNTFADNGTGLSGYAVRNATVRDNRFANNGVGIELSDFYAREGSHQVTIEGNTIQGGERGVLLSWVHENVLRANRVEGQRLQGILLYGGNGNTVEGNILEDNGTGLSLWKGEGNVVRNNIVRRNRGDGLLIYKVASNVLEGNEVEANGRIGIHLINTRGLEVRANRMRLNRYGGIRRAALQQQSGGGQCGRVKRKPTAPACVSRARRGASGEAGLCPRGGRFAGDLPPELRGRRGSRSPSHG